MPIDPRAEELAHHAHIIRDSCEAAGAKHAGGLALAVRRRALAWATEARRRPQHAAPTQAAREQGEARCLTYSRHG